MALRTFGVQTLTGSAQPVLGDVLTAALPIPPDPTVDPIATVANTALYQVGDRITVDPYQANQDSYRVSRILSATTMQLSLEGTQGHAHATNAIIALAINSADIVIQELDGNAAAIVIGSDNTVTSVPGGNACYVLQKATSPTQANGFKLTNSTQGDNVNTADLWVIGTAADKYLAYALVI